MDNEQTEILGYLEQGDTALCVLCAEIVYAFAMNTALAAKMIEAIRHEDVQELSAPLLCVKCSKVIAEAVEDPRLDVFREFVVECDLGGELK